MSYLRQWVSSSETNHFEKNLLEELSILRLNSVLTRKEAFWFDIQKNFNNSTRRKYCGNGLAELKINRSMMQMCETKKSKWFVEHRKIFFSSSQEIHFCPILSELVGGAEKRCKPTIHLTDYSVDTVLCYMSFSYSFPPLRALGSFAHPYFLQSPCVQFSLPPLRGPISFSSRNFSGLAIISCQVPKGSE